MPRAKKSRDPRDDRPDHQPGKRVEFESNRRKVIAAASVCAICGMPLRPDLKFPDPLSTVVDHIIPVSKGGHPSALSNLQAAHSMCNRAKSDRIIPKLDSETQKKAEAISNRDLPWSIDWLAESKGAETEQLIRDAEILRDRGYKLTADGIKKI